MEFEVNRKKVAKAGLCLYALAFILALITFQNEWLWWLGVFGSLGMIFTMYFIIKEETKKENEQNI